MNTPYLVSTCREHQKLLRILITTELLETGFRLGAAFSAAKAIDLVFLQEKGTKETAPVFLVLFLFMGGISLMGWCRARIESRLSRILRTSVRSRLHHYLLTQSARTEKAVSGSLLPQAVEAIDALDLFFSRILPVLLGIGIAMPIFLIAALIVDPLSGLLMLITMPIAPFLLYLIGQVTKKASEREWQRMQEMSTGFAELIRAIPTLKSFRTDKVQGKRVRALSESFSAAALKVLQLSFVSAFALELITTLAIAIIAVSIGFRLLYGELSFLPAFFVLLITPEFFQPLRLAGTAFHAGMTAWTAESSLRKILQTDAAASPDEKPAMEGTLAVSHLSFSYPEAPLPIFSDISFSVPLHHCTVLRGASGCGKTTLIRVLAGILSPMSGTVASGGAIAYMPQEPHLFHASLHDNITLFAAADDASLQPILSAVALDSFAEALPHGLQTRLGEGGQSISQGQRKRLGLARVMYQNTPILLLDEPTAGLDEKTAVLICRALQRLSEDHTLFIVSHDPRIWKMADEILDWEEFA